MMARINEETVTALLSIEIPDQPSEETLAPERSSDLEDGAVQYRHPEADGQEAGTNRVEGRSSNGGQGRTQAAGRSGAARRGPEADEERDESRLIYHGSRAAHHESNRRPSSQTIKRGGTKVGRNDPCPCGSGKKFKKCHGQPPDRSAAL